MQNIIWLFVITVSRICLKSFWRPGPAFGIWRVWGEALPSLLSKIRLKIVAEESIKSLGGFFSTEPRHNRCTLVLWSRIHFVSSLIKVFWLCGSSRYFQIGGANSGGAVHMLGLVNRPSLDEGCCCLGLSAYLGAEPWNCPISESWW